MKPAPRYVVVKCGNPKTGSLKGARGGERWAVFTGTAYVPTAGISQWQGKAEQSRS